MDIMEKINSDSEIVALRNQLYKIYGRSFLWNFESFRGIEDYRQYLKDELKKARLEDEKGIRFRMKHNKFDGEYSEPCLFCFCCKHFDINKKTGSFASCSAFPNGIPLEIWRHKNNHTLPYPGDHGIQYEEDMSIDVDDVILLDENELYGEK